MTDATEEAQERLEAGLGMLDWSDDRLADALNEIGNWIATLAGREGSGVAPPDAYDAHVTVDLAASRLRARQREEGDGGWIRDFVNRQEYLSPDDAELLQDNLWSLYQTTDATPQREGERGWSCPHCMLVTNPHHLSYCAQCGERRPQRKSGAVKRPLDGLLIHLLSVEHADGGVAGVRLRLEWGDPEAPGPYRTEEVRVGAGMAGETFVDTEPPAKREPDRDVYSEIGAALVLAYEDGRRLQDVVVRADVLGKIKSLAESADPEEDE